MKSLVILGAGTAGTIVAHRMRRRLPGWRITVVDPSPTHLFQPGLLYIPFGARDEVSILRTRRRTLEAGIHWLDASVKELDPSMRALRLSSGDRIGYDLLVIASGARLRPDLTPGLEEAVTRGVAHGFYTLPAAQRLRERLAHFSSGRLVVAAVDAPIKGPTAPFEFLFLADEALRRRGVRDRVQLVLACPRQVASRPAQAAHLVEMLQQRGVEVHSDYVTAGVDPDARLLGSTDGRPLPFELLVAIPAHGGAAFVADLPCAGTREFVRTDKSTLAVEGISHAFALGDAAELPTSKAGSVAAFQAEVLQHNLVRAAEGRAPEPRFDGHANWFVESGDGKALMVDFNYEVEPLPGRFPNAVGPFALLRETRMNHLGNVALRSMYWNAVLPGRHIPTIPTQLSMSGKKRSVQPPPSA